MEFDPSIPIYQQIVDEIKKRIIVGILKKGDKVASVRDLAVEMNVNPNTMQKALSILEQEGLLYTERTSGRFITKDEDIIRNLKNNMIRNEVERFFAAMKNMGLTTEEIQEFIKTYKQKIGG